MFIWITQHPFWFQNISSTDLHLNMSYILLISIISFIYLFNFNHFYIYFFTFDLFFVKLQSTTFILFIKIISVMLQY